jgi:hypothetical protein
LGQLFAACDLGDNCVDESFAVITSRADGTGCFWATTPFVVEGWFKGWLERCFDADDFGEQSDADLPLHPVPLVSVKIDGEVFLLAGEESFLGRIAKGSLNPRDRSSILLDRFAEMLLLLPLLLTMSCTCRESECTFLLAGRSFLGGTFVRPVSTPFDVDKFGAKI